MFVLQSFLRKWKVSSQLHDSWGKMHKNTSPGTDGQLSEGRGGGDSLKGGGGRRERIHTADAWTWKRAWGLSVGVRVGCGERRPSERP